MAGLYGDARIGVTNQWNVVIVIVIIIITERYNNIGIHHQHQLNSGCQMTVKAAEHDRAN